MDELLMAVGASKLRWFKESKLEKQETAMTQEMRMMEFAFRMGQTSSQTAASSSAPERTQPVMLAIQDDPARCCGHAQDPWVWWTFALVFRCWICIYIYINVNLALDWKIS